jgi:hypothetical protein
MGVRRVAAGHDTNGKAVFVSGERVPPVTSALPGGFAVHQPWGADETPRLPGDGLLPGYTGYFPPAGGIRFGFTTFPPGRACSPWRTSPSAPSPQSLRTCCPAWRRAWTLPHPACTPQRPHRLRGCSLRRGRA